MTEAVELPGKRLTGADIEAAASLVGAHDIPALQERLAGLQSTIEGQAERETAALAIVQERREALEAAERVLHRERGNLAALRRHAGEAEAAIESKHESRRREAEARRNAEREAERNRKRAIEDELLAQARERARREGRPVEDAEAEAREMAAELAAG